jgi:hypothetical protein
MKKKVLPLAVGAASAVAMTAAHAAMYKNQDGIGESLILPFYSAENGNNTNVSLVNTTDGHKAVKVRIVEAWNSLEVLDFNLYLSPSDHFSFAIVAEGDGAKIVTNDNSCTVPAIPEGGQAFRNLKFDTEKSAADAKDPYDWTGLGRTKVGHIEIIEMGQLDPDFDEATKAGIDPTGKMNAAAAITHDSSGVPANCELLVDAWSTISGVDGVWLDDTGGLATAPAETEFLTTWTGGGLYGYGSVVNVAEGTSYGYDAIAIADQVADGNTGGVMHYQPGSVNPNFADAAFNTSSYIFNNGAVVEFDASDNYLSATVARLQALNATMMVTEIHNDYVTDPTIGATTDWVVTFPTKRAHVNSAVPIEPFTETWDIPTASACEYTSLTIVDREESAPPPPPAPGSSGPDFSPAPPTPPGPAPANDDVPLCYEATVVQFAEESATGSDDSVSVGVSAYLDANDGWASISFDPADADTTLGACNRTGAEPAPLIACARTISDAEDTITGLPAVGFAVQKYVNGNAGGAGVLANYAMATVHKTTVAISN